MPDSETANARPGESEIAPGKMPARSSNGSDSPTHLLKNTYSGDDDSDSSGDIIVPCWDGDLIPRSSRPHLRRKATRRKPGYSDTSPLSGKEKKEIRTLFAGDVLECRNPILNCNFRAKICGITRNKGTNEVQFDMDPYLPVILPDFSVRRIARSKPTKGFKPDRTFMELRSYKAYEGGTKKATVFFGAAARARGVMENVKNEIRMFSEEV